MSNIWVHGFEVPAVMGPIVRRLLSSKALIHSMVFSFLVSVLIAPVSKRDRFMGSGIGLLATEILED